MGTEDKGSYYLGKPHFQVHQDLEDVFLAALYKFRKEPTPNQMDKKKIVLHTAIGNFRKKSARPYHRVRTQVEPFLDCFF